jgi:prefoldin subunit 5
LLEAEEARERGHEAYHATTDPAERLQILRDRVASFEHQIEMLRTKIERLQAMVDETDGRLARARSRIGALTEEMAASTGSEAAR